MDSYSGSTESKNNLLVFTQQPLLPPLDIFGSSCDQEVGRRMSDGGSVSIKSRGSPPTPPHRNTRSSANIRILVDCSVVLFLHDCKCSYILASVSKGGFVLLGKLYVSRSVTFLPKFEGRVFRLQRRPHRTGPICIGNPAAWCFATSDDT